MILSLIFGFLLGVAALLFALQNTEMVALTFLGWQFQSSLAILVIASVIVGMLISMLASLPSVIGSMFKLMRLKRDNRKLTEEVEMHRQVQASASEAPPTPADPLILK